MKKDQLSKSRRDFLKNLKNISLAGGTVIFLGASNLNADLSDITTVGMCGGGMNCGGGGGMCGGGMNCSGS